MAGHRLIDAYLDSLRRRLRWRPDVDEVVAEVEDHLWSTAERFVAVGLDGDLAQRAALERFGDPDLVARAFAAAPTGGLAVPTGSTRTSGTYALISGSLWLVVVGSWWLAGLVEPRYELQGGFSSMSYALGAGSLIAATAFMVAAMLGLDRRHGGLGPLGTAGIILGGIATAGSLLAWVFTGWGSLVALAALLFGVALWRRGTAPRLPVLLLSGGPLVGAVAWAALRGASGSIDLGGLWGSAWLQNQVGLTLGIALLAMGLLGLGRWLRGEEPAPIGESDRPLAA